MKFTILIALLLAGCVGQPFKQVTPAFPKCPELVPTPAPIGKKETIMQFEVRIELSREESVRRHSACLETVAKMQEYIAHH